MGKRPSKIYSLYQWFFSTIFISYYTNKALGMPSDFWQLTRHTVLPGEGSHPPLALLLNSLPSNSCSKHIYVPLTAHCATIQWLKMAALDCHMLAYCRSWVSCKVISSYNTWFLNTLRAWSFYQSLVTTQKSGPSHNLGITVLDTRWIGGPLNSEN